MTVSDNQADDQEQIRNRLVLLLDRLGEQGMSQQAVARRARLLPQYLSDVKLARKPVTERFARRLGKSCEFDYRWLMSGQGDSPGFLELSARQTPSDYAVVRLAVFHSPILGDPWSHPTWNGTTTSLAGAAAVLAQSAKQPYLLRFGKNDHLGRLQEGDLILVSQAVDAQAEIQLVRSPDLLALARNTPDGRWQRVATGKSLKPATEPVGHCIGLVWRHLFESESVSTC